MSEVPGPTVYSIRDESPLVTAGFATCGLFCQCDFSIWSTAR